MTIKEASLASITNFLPALVKQIAPERVVLYGSFAYGNPRDDSDLDLLIVAEMQEGFFTRQAKVRRSIAGLHPFVPLDIVVLTPKELEQRLRDGDLFILEVLTKGRLLYAA